VNALGHADHGERPILQMRQHETPDACQIAQMIALGDRGLFRGLVGRPVLAVQIGEPDFRLTDDEVHGLRLRVELLQDGFDLVAGRFRRTRSRRLLLRAGAYVLRLDVIAQSAEHGTAQMTIRSPAVEFDFRHQHRFQPGGGRVQRRLLREWG
jgi:hypothetical protein